MANTTTRGNTDRIDLLKLYAESNSTKWREWLTRRYATDDLHELELTLRRLQRGMDHLAKEKLNTPKINEWFIRMQRSIERTMRDIIRKHEASPLDNPLLKHDHMDKIGEKRARDQAIENYLKGVRY